MSRCPPRTSTNHNAMSATNRLRWSSSARSVDARDMRNRMPSSTSATGRTVPRSHLRRLSTSRSTSAIVMTGL